jgi:hypothetical protein
MLVPGPRVVSDIRDDPANTANTNPAQLPSRTRTPTTTWTWLVERAAKAARWLGYVPFDRLIDQRNAEPVIREWRHPLPLGLASPISA